MRWYLLSNGAYFYDLYKNASTAIKCHKVDNKLRQPKGTLIAVIRHPLDRLVSAWMEVEPNTPFTEVCDMVCKTPDQDLNPHYRAQAPQLKPKPTKLILFENVTEEFAKMGLKLDKHNVNYGKAHWSHYYTPSWRKKVGQRYQEDFKLYNELHNTRLRLETTR